jgi:hypothetical protein
MSKKIKIAEEDRYEAIGQEIKRLEVIAEKRRIAWIFREFEDYNYYYLESDGSLHNEKKKTEAWKKAVRNTGVSNLDPLINRIEAWGISVPFYKKPKYHILASKLENQLPRAKYGDVILPRHPEAFQALPVEIVDFILTLVPVRHLKSIAPVNKFLASVCRNKR